MSDRQNQIPSFDEVMKPETANGKVPSFDDIMGGVKKKDGLEGGGAVSFGGGVVGAQTSESLKEEKMRLANGITQVQFKKNEHPFDQTKQEAVKDATTKLNEIMYGEGDEWKDPIKATITGVQKSTSPKEAMKHLGARTIIEQSIMPDGYEAKKTLAGTILGQMNDDNLTTKALKEKANKYDKSVQALREIEAPDLTNADELFLKSNFGGQIDNAAVKYYVEKHPEFKRDLKTLGVDINDQFLADRIPSGKRGQIKEEFFNDPNVTTYLEKENPNLIPAFKVAEKNHLTDDTDYGINVVANKVSKAVEKSGYNKIEPIFNVHDAGHEEMNDMVAKEVLTPQELEIWNNHIKPNQSKYIDEPSLAEGVATGIKNTLGSTKKLITEPFTSESQSIKNQWHKEASNVSSDPEGFLKFARDTGSVLGFLMTTGAIGNATGLNSLNALTLATTGDIIQDSREKYRGEPVKATLSGLLNVAMYRALGKSVFPVDKTKAAFTKATPEIDKIVENLTSGKITADAARQEAGTVLGKAIDFAGGTLGTAARIDAELTGLDGLNRVFDKTQMDAATFKKYHADDEMSQNVSHNFLSNIVVAGLGKYGQMKNANNAVSESIYEAASKPNEYKRQVDSNTDLSFADANEIKSNIDYGSLVLKELKKKGISEKNQKRFLFEALQEKAKTEMAAETKEPTLDKNHKEDIKENQEVKERILNGEDHETIVTEKDQKVLDEKEKNQSELESLAKEKELHNKEFDLKVKGLDGRNPEEKIKKEKLELQRESKNADFDKKIEKLNKETDKLEEPKVESKAAVILTEENKKPDIVELKKEVNPEQIEQEKQAKIGEAQKPDIKMPFISSKDLAGSKNSEEHFIKHNEIKDKYKKLRQIIDCLWT